MTINAPQAAARIRQALEAGPTSAWLTHSRDDNKWRENQALAQACEPEALRAILDQMDELAKDAASLREALKQIAEVFPGGWHKDDGTHVANSFIHQARAALTTKDQV